MLRPTLFFFTALILSSSPTFAADSLDQLVRNAAALKLNLFGDELLQPEQAFEFSASVKNSNTLYVSWEITSKYYLYREKIKLELVDAKGVKLGTFTLPKGTPKHDEAFGNVEIFSGDLNFNVPLIRENNAVQTVTLRASFQGCAERGVCYPPMKKEVVLELPASK
jgi:thiol:disulfide interchange protein DsbD